MVLSQSQSQKETGHSVPTHPSFDAVGPLGCKHTAGPCSAFLSTRNPRSFSVGLLSMSSSPSLYSYLGLPRPKCNALHMDLLNLMRFTWAHCSACLGSSGWHPIPWTCWPHHTAWGHLQTAEGALDPTADIRDKVVKKHQPLH